MLTGTSSLSKEKIEMTAKLPSSSALESALHILKTHSYLRLEAVCEPKNIYRFYEIYLTRDLFNRCCVMTSFGRLATHGTQKSYSFETQEDLDKKLQQILLKRLKSEKRIGVGYGFMLNDSEKEHHLSMT